MFAAILPRRIFATFRKMTNTPEQLRKVIDEIINTPTGNEFITFEITEVAPISVAKKYAGISASLVARIKNTKTDDFNVVMKTIKLFLQEPFSAAIKNNDFMNHWTATEEKWK